MSNRGQYPTLRRMGAFPDWGSWQREAGVLSQGQLWGRPPLPLLSDAVETVFLSQAAHCTRTRAWGSSHSAEAAGSPLGRLLPSLPASLPTLPGSQCVQELGGQGPVAGDRGPLCCGPPKRGCLQECLEASCASLWSWTEALHAPLTDLMSSCRVCMLSKEQWNCSIIILSSHRQLSS